MSHRSLVSIALPISSSLACSLAHSQQLDWIRISEVDHAVFELRNGSLSVSGSGPDDTVSMLGRSIGRNQTVQFFVYEVSQREFQQEYGVLKIATVQGDIEKRAGFVFSGGNAASMIAEVICDRAVAAAAAAAAEAATSEWQK